MPEYQIVRTVREEKVTLWAVTSSAYTKDDERRLVLEEPTHVKIIHEEADIDGLLFTREYNEQSRGGDFNWQHGLSEDAVLFINEDETWIIVDSGGYDAVSVDAAGESELLGWLQRRAARRAQA